MTEPQAIESGMRFHINRGVMTGRRAGSDRSRLSTKFSLKAPLARALNLFGHNAARTIHIFALAIKFGLTTHDLKKSALGISDAHFRCEVYARLMGFHLFRVGRILPLFRSGISPLIPRFAG
jgi:hypothetical protein